GGARRRPTAHARRGVLGHRPAGARRRRGAAGQANPPQLGVEAALRRHLPHLRAAHLSRFVAMTRRAPMRASLRWLALGAALAACGRPSSSGPSGAVTIDYTETTAHAVDTDPGDGPSANGHAVALRGVVAVT